LRQYVEKVRVVLSEYRLRYRLSSKNEERRTRASHGTSSESEEAAGASESQSATQNAISSGTGPFGTKEVNSSKVVNGRRADLTSGMVSKVYESAVKKQVLGVRIYQRSGATKNSVVENGSIRGRIKAILRVAQTLGSVRAAVTVRLSSADGNTIIIGIDNRVVQAVGYAWEIGQCIR
jgi:hypothetical protein